MDPRRARIRSFAKLNLDLRVLGKRPDGFHELRTVFQTISLADTLEIEFVPARRTSIELAGNINIPNNLVVRAAEAVAARTGVRGRIRLQLTKRIPMGGGLGGGSSNAAAVLLALPVLAGKAVPLEKLAEIGSDLGSDVPFFLYGGAALGVGRGTELYPLPEPRGTGILVTPGVHVSTAEAYAALQRPPLDRNEALTPGSSPLDTRSFQAFTWALESRDPRWRALGINDFEPPVFARFPQLKLLKTKLRKLGARPALMTGSGSALFGIFESREDARRARERLGNVPAYEFSLVSRDQYRRSWRRQLIEHLQTDEQWPPQSRYV